MIVWLAEEHYRDLDTISYAVGVALTKETAEKLLRRECPTFGVLNELASEPDVGVFVYDDTVDSDRHYSITKFRVVER